MLIEVKTALRSAADMVCVCIHGNTNQRLRLGPAALRKGNTGRGGPRARSASVEAMKDFGGVVRAAAKGAGVGGAPRRGPYRSVAADAKNDKKHYRNVFVVFALRSACFQREHRAARVRKRRRKETVTAKTNPPPTAAPKEMKILTAQLRLKNADPTAPALYMKGDKHWLLTFIAMLYETMKRENDLTDEEATRLLHAECFHLDMYRYRVRGSDTITDATKQ